MGLLTLQWSATATYTKCVRRRCAAAAEAGLSGQLGLPVLDMGFGARRTIGAAVHFVRILSEPFSHISLFSLFFVPVA